LTRTRRGGVHRCDVSSHQYSGFLVPNGCSGWICTVPVLTADTAFTAAADPRSVRETVIESFIAIRP
jgi:hypothetical protein